MAQPSGGDAQAQAMTSMMLPMIVMILVMFLMYYIPGLRILLADSAGLAIEPILPFHEEYFVPTVFIVGASIMAVNTVIRAYFIDPIKQAHFSHRQRQVQRQVREAQMARDTARVEKMQKLQMEMMPEQLANQSAMMRPMMFTIVFIIAIFAWIQSEVETFRVSFVSLPWVPMWSFNERILWIFPAWIATYITMSAPLSRIIDRHLKILRFRSHPVVLAADPLPEPLLHLIKDDKPKNNSRERRSRMAQRRRDGPRKKGQPIESEKPKGGNLHTSAPRAGTICPACSTDMVSRSQKGRLRCEVCRHEWR
ncbi:MAG: EMC3/TMCO1 family protein [Candidatus Thermoplasmatota archaeon]|nr:EMC3/TMCO1 family protein [Candidatus Thermoplasmatota archaeon]